MMQDHEMTSDSDKAAKARAKDLRARIDTLTGKRPVRKVAPGKESPRDFIERRMTELDKD
jgi:hypothetical protein